MEYGIIIPQGIRYLRKQMPLILEDAENELSGLGREIFSDFYDQLKDKDKRGKLSKSPIDSFLIFN